MISAIEQGEAHLSVDAGTGVLKRDPQLRHRPAMADGLKNDDAVTVPKHRGVERQMQAFVRILAKVSGPKGQASRRAARARPVHCRASTGNAAGSWRPDRAPEAKRISSGRSRPSDAATERPPSVPAAPNAADRGAGCVDATSGSAHDGAGSWDPLGLGLVSQPHAPVDP